MTSSHRRYPDVSRHSATPTDLLIRWGAGDESALRELVPLVHREMHQIARRYMARERVGHTLQATALVNETFVRLVNAKTISFHDRAHFLATCAQVMRRILVDHGRARSAEKRGGHAVRVDFDEGLPVSDDRRSQVVLLDDAMQALACLDERKSKVVELRFFGGLSVNEIAAIVNVSPETVMRDWQFAKAWLQRAMRDAGRGD
ncbi:MAG: sigma-70 family RNA polymerase sigma factor [Vicinamibacterales bacterium]